MLIMIYITLLFNNQLWTKDFKKMRLRAYLLVESKKELIRAREKKGSVEGEWSGKKAKDQLFYSLAKTHLDFIIRRRRL